MSGRCFEDVLEDLRRYRDARDWKQFHTPKDLAIAVATEAAELLEHFLWREGEEVDAHLASAAGEVELEVADIAIFLAFFCDACDIDLVQAIDRKQELNEERHPVDCTRGRARPQGQ